MELSDLQTLFGAPVQNFELIVDKASLFKAGDAVTINEFGKEFSVRATSSEDAVCSAHFVTEAQRDEFAHGRALLLRVRGVKGKRLFVEGIEISNRDFGDRVMQDGTMKIAVVDEVLRKEYGTPALLSEYIKQNYAFKIGNETYFVLGENKEDRENKGFILVDAANKRYFAVTEKDVAALSVVQQNDTDGDAGFPRGKALVISAAERPLCNFDRWIFRLDRVGIEIVDKTRHEQLVATALSYVRSNSEGYVKLWKKYADAEKELHEKWMDDAGKLDIRGFKVISVEGDYEFEINNGSDIAKFERIVGDHFDGQIKILIEGKRGATSITSGVLKSVENKRGFLTASINRDLRADDRQMWIVPDNAGNLIVHERRKMAADAILEGKAANPYIVALLDGRRPLEEKGHAARTLDGEIMYSVFGENGANYEQCEAIRVALNTPDFAIIQGPPGTGKTRVIRAILAHYQKFERESKKKCDDSERSSFLVTAYQREATRNIVGDMVDDRFGLPVFTYTENTARSDGEDENLRRLEKWCEESRNAIPNLQEIERVSELKKLVSRINHCRDELAYVVDVKRAEALISPLLAEIRKATVALQAKNTFQEGTIDELERHCGVLKRRCNRLEEEDKTNCLRSLIASIPTCKAVLDDAAGRLKDIANLLVCIAKEEERGSGGGARRYIPTEEIARLEELAAKSELEKEDYQKLAELKVAMALKLRQNKILTEEDKNELIETVDKVALALNAMRLRCNKAEILSDYADKLGATEELRQALMKYRAIDAATHQKTLSHYLSNGDEIPFYKNVLVDEAARSCPSDLLIPIACAEEKVVLVGDEKQLPQFLNEDTLGILKQSMTADEIKKLLDELRPEELQTDRGARQSGGSFFSVSMFEYMIHTAQVLQRRDLNHRRRVVELRTQYRMAPVLGELVSEVFYDSNLENGIKDEKHFELDYPLIEGKNMIWLDVPSALNQEIKDGKASAFRELEVSAIRELLLKLADSVSRANAGSEGTAAVEIGIITGYNAQKRHIENMLDKEEDRLGKIRRYIQVGTVDSFQGKEFDIVILSAVRTREYGFWNVIDKTEEWDLPRAGRQRSCVAFSRAKKCMIVVASEIFRDKKAAVKAPAFAEFYKRCEEKRDGRCCVKLFGEGGII